MRKDVVMLKMKWIKPEESSWLAKWGMVTVQRSKWN